MNDPYLTPKDLVFLYQKTSMVLHAPNPYQGGSKVVDFRHSLDEWVRRIQTLLATHYMRLVDSDTLLLVIMNDPRDGKVHVLRGEAIPDTTSDTPP